MHTYIIYTEIIYTDKNHNLEKHYVMQYETCKWFEWSHDHTVYWWYWFEIYIKKRLKIYPKKQN